MNVFDVEMGPLCPQEDAELLLMLAEAGLTLAQVRAWRKLCNGTALDQVD